MATDRRTFPAGIYGVVDENYGELVGTGTIVEIYGDSYLLTAAHVMKSANDKSRFRDIAFSIYAGKYPIVIDKNISVTEEPYDLALAELAEDDLKSKIIYLPGSLDPGKDFAPLNAVRELAFSSQNLSSEELFFVHGLPGVRSRFTMFDNARHSSTLPYTATVGTCVDPTFDPTLHISIDYPRYGVDDHGKRIEMPDPHGMSGSALWRVNQSAQLDKQWSTAMAQIVGVVTGWDPVSNCLVATRIEIVHKYKDMAIANHFGRHV